MLAILLRAAIKKPHRVPNKRRACDGFLNDSIRRCFLCIWNVSEPNFSHFPAIALLAQQRLCGLGCEVVI